MLKIFPWDLGSFTLRVCVCGVVVVVWESEGDATKVLIVDLGDDSVENVSLSYRMHK